MNTTQQRGSAQDQRDDSDGGLEHFIRSSNELIDPITVERDYGIKKQTQAVWRSANRYGFRDLANKMGASVRYRRSDIEQWIESRRSSALAQVAAS